MLIPPRAPLGKPADLEIGAAATLEELIQEVGNDLGWLEFPVLIEEAEQKSERKQVWRVAYEKCISSDSETCISEADKAVAAYDKMVEAMKERFG